MEVAVKGKAKRRHLNSEECDELGRSGVASDVLAQPQSVSHTQGTSDPNQRLYPKTPTKQQKRGCTSRSPAWRNRCIDTFYPVTRIVSSSPQKLDQGCSSLQANIPNGEIVLQEHLSDEELRMMEEAADDTDDDVSLLAVPLQPESEKEMNYLEGLTPEMFVDDNEWDQSDTKNGSQVNSEEEEVEALPDVHYGLLGNCRDLIEPQGCVDDLPEEVLRLVLCLLPARDLYSGVMLTCKRWRDIVCDPKFVPFKKQYYRYMLEEKGTVEEINSLLNTSGITGPVSDRSVRSLVVLMAQHKAGERVQLDSVLECVKKHRLFPHAEASIRLRMPDIQMDLSVGTAHPNPYAAMAVILLFSQTVSDVRSLVSLLTTCMSSVAITEYLSHTGMMLLALQRNGVKISNRLHYNIYYVLHLMENSCVSSGHNRQPQLKLTSEQQRILSHDIREDHVVKIIAFAGTGKTTTLIKFAEKRPHLRFLYVAFNKSVAVEATRRFPVNVHCRTVHSMAYRDIGKRYKDHKKLTCKLSPFSISSILPAGRGGYANSKVVVTVLNAYMASADRNISVDHVSRKNRDGVSVVLKPEEKLMYVRDAEMIWDKMKDLSSVSEENSYCMTHDGYLKLWQLQDPKPLLSDQYDVIFIDEAQDCTPAIIDVLMSQSCAKILVGDPHQQIYTFKGAVNALDLIQHTHIYYLTESFRFGSEIAYIGNTILKVCKNVKKILVGQDVKGGVCDESTDKILTTARSGEGQNVGTTAILSRTNVTVFSEAVRLTDANLQCRIHFIGGVMNIGLERILDIWQLMMGEPTYVKDSFIRIFARKKNGYFSLKMYAKETEDLELQNKLSIADAYRNRVPELVRRLKSCHEDDLRKADFILGTVHKSKGLEFDNVLVTDDFIKVPNSRHNRHRGSFFSISDYPDDEWNLLYVAVTRARTSLVITKSIYNILTLAGEYMLKPAMRSDLQEQVQLLPCCIPDCPNCTRPDSAFLMCKQERKFMDITCFGRSTLRKVRVDTHRAVRLPHD
ncbi:F-box DNA helicase 1 [Thalassophryne amazonica]|uniref:F-box DNA helicase 1 n=1 Tax=Thalassophryne amazonica TaxID=390379 RepID=UPI0014726A0B|nr:F-box DNA helicase 1 [Thalassophryne amazonica]